MRWLQMVRSPSSDIIHNLDTTHCSVSAMLQKDTKVDKLYVVMINLYVCTQVIVYMYVDEQMM